MADEKTTSIDEVFVWGICDRTGYSRFYYTKERANLAAGIRSPHVKKVSFLEAHKIHNEDRRLIFKLPPVSLAKFERIVEGATESFTHRLFHSKT